MPYITATQQSIPRSHGFTFTRSIYLEVDQEIFDKFTNLSLKIVIEVGDDIMSITGTWTDKTGKARELIKIADNAPTSPKNACIELINEIHATV